MGCFSDICPICGGGINSTSYDGERCILALLQDGKCVEYMSGRYDSYGKVFKEGGIHELFGKSNVVLKDDVSDESINWETRSWNNLISNHFNLNTTTGFLAIHDRCWNNNLPGFISYADPDQGWNEIIVSDIVPDYKEFFKLYFDTENMK